MAKKLQQIQAKIGEIIDSSSDLHIQLDQITLELGKFFLADSCLILMQLDCRDTFLKGYWHNNYDQNIEISFSFNQELLINSEILTIDECLFVTIDDLVQKAKTPQYNFLGKLLNAEALLISTFKILENKYCWFVLGKNKPYTWTKTEQESCKNLITWLSLGLKFIQIQKTPQSTIQDYQLLHQLTEAIRYTSNPNSLFALFLENIAKALQVNRGLILTLKYKNPLFKRLGNNAIPQGKAKVVCQWFGGQTEPITNEQQSFRIADSLFLLEALYQAPECFAIADKSDFSTLTSKNPPVIFYPNKTVALLFVPLMGSMSSEAKTPVVLGFIILEDQKIRQWFKEELALVNWVSTQLSTTIIHNQSLSRVQSLVDERTSQLKWSLDVQAKLSEKMRQQLRELQELNRLKDEFLSSMSHELNTPLTNMKMAIKMLRQPECSSERKEKYLDILEQEWNREYNLIKDLLTLQKLESNKLNFQPQEVDLPELIDVLAQGFREKWHDSKSLNLLTSYHDLGEDNLNCQNISATNLKLYIDPNTLEQIINELLHNAGKYSQPNTNVSIHATGQITNQGNKIIVTVTNYGLGITPEEQKYIFDKFRRGKGVTDQAIPGTGLGLTMVKSLVEHLEGTIEVSSHPAENSSTFVNSFTLTLPQFLK